MIISLFVLLISTSERTRLFYRRECVIKSLGQNPYTFHKNESLSRHSYTFHYAVIIFKFPTELITLDLPPAELMKFNLTWKVNTSLFGSAFLKQYVMII